MYVSQDVQTKIKHGHTPKYEGDVDMASGYVPLENRHGANGQMQLLQKSYQRIERVANNAAWSLALMIGGRDQLLRENAAEALNKQINE